MSEVRILSPRPARTRSSFCATASNLWGARSAMAQARIYRPAKTAMQSGRGKTRKWVLEHEPPTGGGRDPLMGWTSSANTSTQVRLHFDTIDEARTFADRQ